MAHAHEEHSAGHDHRHGHDHGAGHSHAPASFDRAFAVGVTLNLIIVAAGLVFGYLANSLALIADAAHNFTDVVGLLLAWGGAWLAARQPTKRYTYGFRRASILAAVGNAALLLVAVGGILIEAAHRFQNPEPVATGVVMSVAALGIVVNGATALMFMSGRKDDLNIKGAFLHMVGDTGISLGVVLGTALVAGTGWFWLDPAISVAIALAVLWSTWSLARELDQPCARRHPARDRPRGRARLPTKPARGDRGARPTHMGHEHNRNGAHRPHRAAGRKPRRSYAARGVS